MDKPIDFELRFEGCGHVLRIPLMHAAGHVNCFVCRPELRDRPAPGCCPQCQHEKNERGAPATKRSAFSGG